MKISETKLREVREPLAQAQQEAIDAFRNKHLEEALAK